MARYQFDDIEDEPRWIDNTTHITQLIVRGVGFLLLIVGLWIGLKVINEAWSLYQQPENIERFARAIEKGSNLDKALSAAENSNLESRRSEPAAAISSSDALGLRLSYFVAWVVAILLLMLVGRLSIAAIKTGGELALYDLQIKKFARHLAGQARGNIQS